MVSFSTTQKAPSDGVSADLTCRKLLLQAKALVAHGIADEAIDLLKKVGEMTKHHGLNQVRAMSLDLLQEISDGSFKDFTTDSAKVEMNLEIHLTKVRARNLYKKLDEKGLCAFNRDDEMLIAQVKRLCESQWTPALGYWHHMLALKANFLNDRIAKAYWHGLRLNEALKRLEYSISNDQLFDFYHEMSLLLTKAKKFSKAELYARKAEMLCDKDHVDLLKILELRFVFGYGRKDGQTCLAIWQEAMVHPAVDKDDLIYYKWVFFEACLQFSEKDFGQSLVLLSKSAAVCRDKKGYFIEHGLLEILNLIETEEYELLEYKIESFSKLVECHNDRCFEPIQGIMKFFRTLVKSNYDLSTAYLQHHESLRLIIEEGRNRQLISLIDVMGWIKSKVDYTDLKMVG